MTAAGRARLGLAYAVPAGRGVWPGGDVPAPLAAGTPIFLEIRSAKRWLRSCQSKPWWCAIKAVVVSMLLTASLGGHRGGDFDVAGLAAKQYGFAPAVTLQGGTISRPLCFALAAWPPGWLSIVSVPAFLSLAACYWPYPSWAFYHLAGSHPEQLFLLYGVVGLCVGRCRGGTVCDGRAFPPEVPSPGSHFHATSRMPSLAD